MTKVKQMVEYVSKSLADQPEVVKIDESVTENRLMVELDVAPGDMGRIIGRRGRTINAIRAVARVLGKKMNKRVSLELLE